MDYMDYYSYYSDYPSNFDFSMDTSSGLSALMGFLGGMFIMVIIIAIAAGIFTIIGQWKMFKKAGAEGYISLLPVYSLIKEMRLGGLPIYWFFLVYCAVIPLIGWIGPVVLAFWKNINLAKSFGKGTGTGVLLTFFPFVMYPILGFGKAEYVGPQGQIQVEVEDKE